MASPVRFREDANAEEDFALGGYRDRLIVELAQNGADAAARAGVPGRLHLVLRPVSVEDPPAFGGPGDVVLVVANTGAALDEAGAQSLATLRASAKTGGPAPGGGAPLVGRFGVGFAAVVAVSDAPMVLSRSGGVRFARADTVTAIDGADPGPERDGLLAEVRRRSGHVPVLRLPFPQSGSPPDGYDTAVVLPLRDAAAVASVRAQLEGVSDVLLLALPALAEVTIDIADGVDGPPVRRTVADAAHRWWVHRRVGAWTDDERRVLVADRPTEEHAARGWQVLWALPRGDVRRPEVPLAGPETGFGGWDAASDLAPGSGRGTVHAPTPTDEPLSLPGLLVATLPLDPTRRHVAPGRLTDRVLREAAAGYVALLAERAAAGGNVLPLIPTGLPAGAVDGALHDQVLRLLASAPVLLPASGGAPIRPSDAVRLDVDLPEPALALVAPLVDRLVRPPRGPRDVAALAALDVPVVPLAEVVAGLPATDQLASWRTWYEALAPLATDAAGREALGLLPVPLVDGELVRGPRGLVLAQDVTTSASPADGDAGPLPAVAVLRSFGLRIVHPEAWHPLLERLGAVSVTARGLVEHPAVRAAVRESGRLDDVDLATELATAVLTVVCQAVRVGQLNVGDLPWLADLVLTDIRGDLVPAGGLAVPRSPAADLLDADEVGSPAATWLDQWSREVLAAAGVLDDLALVRAEDVDLLAPPDDLVDLDGFPEWAEAVTAQLPAGATLAEVSLLLAVRDLDAILPGRWPVALRYLATTPSTRQALLQPVHVDGRAGLSGTVPSWTAVPSYTAWWWRRELALGPAVVGADPTGLLDPAPSWLADLDPQVRRALGVLDPADLTVSSFDKQPEPALVVELLRRLGDPDRRPDVRTCVAVWRWAADADGLVVAPPAVVRALAGRTTRVVDAADAVVPDDPRWAQRTDLGDLVLAPAGRAQRLADLLDLDLASDRADGRPDAPGVAVPVPTVVRQVLAGAAQSWREHDDLTVDGQSVEWWVDVDGIAHAATTEGLARALSWAAGDWPARHRVAAVLADPEEGVRSLVEDATG
ncbi:MAG: sacsin N-terminal ATP-binding-like domain-containing protein [Angustibacter sp.]